MNSAVRKSVPAPVLADGRLDAAGGQAQALSHALAPSRAVGRLIKQVFASLIHNIDERMQPFGLTAMQWEPLMLLHFERADTVAALARESQVGCGSMTRMLDRLERKALLRRRRSSVDRRVVHVELTAKGKKVVGAILPIAIAGIDRHLEDFSAADVTRLTQLLQRMLENGSRPGHASRSHD